MTPDAEYEPEAVDLPGDPGVRYARIPIPGLGMYAAGDDGSVWSRWSGRWERLDPFAHTSGHLAVNCVFMSGGRHRVYVHVLVCSAFYGPQPAPGSEACHAPNPDPRDCRAANLRWDTRSGNNRDRAVHRSLMG